MKTASRPAKTVKALTARIENALREVTLNAESDAELHTARIAEQIFASAEMNETLGEKREFLQKFVNETSMDTASGEDKLLHRRVMDYDKKLGELGIEPQHLSLAQFSRGSVIVQALKQIWPLILLAPLAAAGAVIHFPAYRLSDLLARIYTKHGADDIASTVKVLAGMVFMPLTWLIAAAVLFYFFGWEIALASIPAAVICGYAALYTFEEIEELRGWAKAIWLFLTKREAFLRMFVERRDLNRQLSEFGT